ncbi:hypothetical protein B5T_03652 [Alloalcanivorax dieselolei B5]|uniref:BioF2-like acetyltransferase domain-containing protein n=1 Tax=Alcanivorax dieselolei (strain DSM 16502 / CGMCC 1.3690 / MCCC 1A00001 / B-5) TaxID=930169 RepID=K0CK33_ALCDB|nr:peptidogalycan biosysnthesis protein [Alloalcanivorax dieselolei]AFT71916.1 hypothetical protein B5T_03652 [Alloalcanivorax dieselolei B5]GGK08827.1 hypothetical protein GCM10007426_41360 [Alloalcanivorax dieselolei]
MLAVPIPEPLLPRYGETSVRLCPSVRTLDRHAWDALVSDSNFFNSHRWLASLEYAFGPQETLAVFGAGGLMAGCPVWKGQPDDALFNPSTLFGGLAGPWEEHFLWGGAYRATHNEPVVTVGSRRRSAQRLLLSALKQLATQRDQAGVILPYIPLHHALTLRRSHPETQIILHTAEAFQPISSGGLQATVSAWRKRYRSRTWSEISAFRNHGNAIEWSSLTPELEPVVARLVTSNRHKYGSQAGEAWMSRILSGQKQAGLHQNIILATARHGDRVTAVCVFYRFGKALHLRYFGSDYQHRDNDFRYFILGYYAPLDFAARQGFSVSHLSISALDAKAKRGGIVTPLAAVVMLRDGPLDPRLVAEHNLAIQHFYQSRYQHYTSTDWKLVNTP